MAARARTLTLRTQVEVTGADKLNNLGKKFQKAGAALTLGITTPLTLLGGVAARAASDLNESFNAINVTFGESADAINKIGETSAESMGLSQRAFNEAATRFSAFAGTVAGEGGDVAGVIESLTQRGADFASVYNLEVADALALFQSGLAGETEPLRKFGIDLSAAAVEAHALATGISNGVGELTEAQKVQARYSLLLERTSKVQGDFAATSQDVANAQRIAAAEAENAAAALGRKFLPIQQKIIEVLSGALDAWSKLPAPMQDAVVVFGAAAAALGPLLLGLGSLIRVAPHVGRAFTAMLGPVGLVVIGATALALVLEDIGKKLDPAGVALKDFVDRIGPENWGAFSGAAEEAGDTIDEFAAKVGAAMDEGLDFDDALRSASDDLSQFEGQFKGWGDRSVRTVQEATASMAGEFGELPEKAADELLANQFHLTDAIDELINFMDQALTPAEEVFNARMFLASQAAAEGLASGNPLVRQKTQEMVDAANAVLAQFGKSAFNYGYNFGASYAAGVVNSLGLVRDAGRQLGGALANQVRIESEPPDHTSPLYGITKWGGNIAKTYAAGILRELGAVSSASRALAGAVGLGGLAGIGSMRPSGVASNAGTSGGTVINNYYFQWEGEGPKARNEAEIIANLQRLSPLVGGKLGPGY